MSDELTISLHGSQADAGTVITIQVEDGGRYSLVEDALRCFTGWLTVKARRLCRRLVSSVRRVFRNAIPWTGIPILRQCSILRF